MSSKVNEALKQHFRPEFLNRDRRSDRVPRALQGRGHRDRRLDDASASVGSSRRRAEHRAHQGSQVPGRRKRLRPDDGCPPAAPCARSGWSRTRCRRGSSRRSSGPATPSSSTPTTARSPSGVMEHFEPAAGRAGRRRQPATSAPGLPRGNGSQAPGLGFGGAGRSRPV